VAELVEAIPTPTGVEQHCTFTEKCNTFGVVCGVDGVAYPPIAYGNRGLSNFFPFGKRRQKAGFDKLSLQAPAAVFCELLIFM
jgi:hypothetical protein